MCHVNLLFHVHIFSPKPKGKLPLLPAISSLQNSPQTSVRSMPQHLARGISQVHASVKQIKSRGFFFKVWEMFGWNNVTADIMEVIQHLLVFLAGRKLTAARQGKLFSNVIALNHPAIKRASLFYFFFFFPSIQRCFATLEDKKCRKVFAPSLSGAVAFSCDWY